MAPLLTIGDREIGSSHPSFIIAEIGQNHQGDITLAKKLIDEAKKAGADCVKFQKTCLQEKFTKDALEQPYLSENSWGSTYGKHKQYLEFTDEEFKELQNFSSGKDILFSASAMDPGSVKFLQSLNVPFIKIGSGDSNNLILIEQAARTNIPLIISTGMQDFDGVQKIHQCVSKFHKKFALLHCVSAYPTPLEDVNLKVLNLYKEEFPDVVIGYSGHELGIDISVSAVAMGANVIERHFTLDKTQKGSDHKCSLEPEEFKKLVEKIRIIEKAMGQPLKLFLESEKPCYQKLGKSIVASRALSAGQVLNGEDLNIKVSFPKGLDGNKISYVIGKVVKDNIQKDEPIIEEMLV